MKHRLQALAFLVGIAIAGGVPAQTNSSAKSGEKAKPVKTDAVSYKVKTIVDGEGLQPPSREDIHGVPGDQVKTLSDQGPSPVDAPIDPTGSGCCQSGTCQCRTRELE